MKKIFSKPMVWPNPLCSGDTNETVVPMPIHSRAGIVPIVIHFDPKITEVIGPIIRAYFRDAKKRGEL